eukprot:TRINITY_DN10839_c0_g1_i2.p1 TRINITY_DN10839_c0_g1~~TRINITY_DN10839_c0_g1_i2.p1  ORF type:complete len:131 (+),score=32.33 TRINITY_DN10839_c0_g1_i2:49-393(+)
MGSIGSTSMKAFYLIAALLTIAFSPLNGQDVDAGPMDQQEPRYACPEVHIGFDPEYQIGAIPDVASWHACGTICNLVTDCKFWTWNLGHNCYLKSSDHGIYYNEADTSGQKGCK